MTEFTEKVEKQRQLNLAEEWGKGIRYVHASDGVIETKFNNGDVRYEQNKPGGKITWVRENNLLEPLIDKFQRALADMQTKN